MKNLKINASQVFFKSLFLTAIVYTHLYTFKAHSELRPQTTSRLVSTAGSGVGSVLMEESNVLNPASIAFFNSSSIYYQQARVENNENEDRLGESFSVIASDTSGSLKGSGSYHKAEAGSLSRERISLNAASAAGETSSFGITASQIKETTFDENGVLQNDRYRTLNLGVTHVVSPKMSVGVVVNDLTKTGGISDSAIFGMHFQMQQYIALMADVGTNYRAQNINERYLYRAAVQLTVLTDFYLRGGFSRDLIEENEERRTGLGISWVQPKLTLDFAFQDIETSQNDENLISQAVTYREASLSIGYRF